MTPRYRREFERQAQAKLLAEVIDAHGGLERRNAHKQVEASIVSGGGFFALKGVDPGPGPATDDRMAARAAGAAAAIRCPGPAHVFTSDRIAIEKVNGTVVADRFAPTDSFAGHQKQTQWDDLHRAYFNGEALWTYLTTPFLMAEDGCTG